MRRRPRKAGGTLKDGERRQLARASRAVSVTPVAGGRDRVHCDGGSRGNPGPAAIAAVLLGADGTVVERAARIGRASAGEAEYRAMLLGLALAAEHGMVELEVCSDSQLALAGVVGDGPAEPSLAALAEEVREAAREFTSVTWTWHPRAENTAADELVRELLWGPPPTLG